MSKDKKKEQIKDDFLAQESKEAQETAQAYTLDIPEDEIWTYQIDGLQAPHVNKPFKNAKIKKIIVVIFLVLAIGTSIYLSVRAVHSDTYKYNQLEDGTYELVKFSNPGDIIDVTIDYVVDLETGEKDTTKPITKIHEYAFNCDETLRSITIGKDVKEIDGKSIYSCWWITDVYVDDENQYLCDLDGVLYNKDITEVIFYPNDHDKSLRLQLGYNVPTIRVNKDGTPIDKNDLRGDTTIDDYFRMDENWNPITDENGNIADADMLKDNTLFADDGKVMEELWGTTKLYDEAYYQNYNREVRTYVIPSTVTKIGELAFAYSNIVDLYIPQGVTEMDNMAIFKNTVLVNLYSYTTDKVITDTTYKAMDDMTSIYASLPEGLETIGSDCFYYTRGLAYMYLPSSVKSIGHHAFWDSVYKEDKELKGVTCINTSADEESFKNVEKGDQWRGQYDYMLFKKSVPVNYSAERQSQVAYNTNRQYYWAVQWIINNTSDDVKNNSSYLVKDFDNDGVPELVLRQYDENAKKTEDKVITMNYGYLDDFDGKAEYTDAEFSALDDNTQLDSILETVE